ncbi:hypothetical protein JXR93_04315 [bacterium]|nr:hypothetical protein [bacterium]
MISLIKKTVLSSFLFFLITISFGGCSDSSNNQDEKCAGVVCKESEECINDVCVDIVNNHCSLENLDGDCEDGFICENGICVEESSNPCEPNPCGELNKTVCSVSGNSFICGCDSGYIDDNGICKQEECSGNGELNGENICVCSGVFSGENCSSWEIRWGARSESSALKSKLDSTESYIYTIGYYGNSSGTYTPTLTKHSINGDKIWEKSWGNQEIYQMPVALSFGKNGEIYIAGESGNETYSVFVTKFSSDGVEGWTKTWSSEYGVFVWDIASDTNGEFYVTGTTFSSMKTGLTLKGDSDIFVIKGKDSGSKCDEVWLVQPGTDKMDSGKKIVIKDDIIYLLAELDGDTSIDENIGAIMFKFAILQLNYSGDILKESIFLEDVVDGYLSSFIFDVDSNIYVTGDAKKGFDGLENSGDSDIFLLKLNSTFEKIWSKILGSEEYDTANDLSLTSDGYIYVVSHTYGSIGEDLNKGESDILISKWSFDGELLVTKMIGDDNIESGEAALNLQVDSKNNLFITGVAESIYQDDASVKSKALLKKISFEDRF